MAQSPETVSKIAGFRRKAVEGTLTPAEMREAIIILRADRRAAATSSAQSARSRAKKTIKSADELLADLGL